MPTDFWNAVRAELDEIKPVFMLAEWESRDLHAEAFDMTYAWSWNQTMHHIAMGKTDIEPLRVYYAWNERAYPHDVMRMMFVSNHDKNAWEGTEFEQFGDALEAAIALSVVGDGMPLIYSGQEAGNDKRLEFFERDPIVWRDHPNARAVPAAVRAQAAEHRPVERALGSPDDRRPEHRAEVGAQLRPAERPGQGLRGVQSVPCSTTR